MQSCRAVLIAVMVVAVPVRAQSAGEQGRPPAIAGSTAAHGVHEHIARGDRAVAALDPAAALRHYRAAIAVDPMSIEALWKASRSAIDLGEFEPDGRKQALLFADGEQAARRAVELDPRNADTRFSLARALGRTALSVGIRERVRYATAVRDHAGAALAIDSTHAGALHVMGMWNAEVMRLNGLSRAIARNFLGGQVFGSANWENAVRYMERSVASEPDVISHRLDLAKIYLDLAEGKRSAEYTARARAELQRVMNTPPTQFNDRHYVSETERLLRRR